MEWQVSLADLDYGIDEEMAVLGVLRSKWLTMGAVTQQFEAEFAKATGAQYAFAVSNATEALHLACLALGIGPGDEVIAPSLSFVATTNAVLYTGGTVRFADIIGPNELTIDPNEIERLITPHTRAIIVMHYGGYACQMDAILDIAARNNLEVIEDTAHAPGAFLNGKALGTFGAAGCFSFFSNKNLSTGEGGMVTTNREDIAKKVRLQRSHGMTTLTYDRHHGHAHSYDVVDLGYNYRIDEIRSALGLVQLKKLPANNALRERFTLQYRQALKELGVGLPFENTRGQAAYHIFPMLLPEGTNRDQFIERMREQGIQTSIHYSPIHTFSYYRNRFGDLSLPRTEEVGRREVTLPLYPTMGEEKVAQVVAAIRQSL